MLAAGSDLLPWNISQFAYKVAYLAFKSRLTKLSYILEIKNIFINDLLAKRII